MPSMEQQSQGRGAEQSHHPRMVLSVVSLNAHSFWQLQRNRNAWIPSVLSIQVEFQVLKGLHIRLPPVPEKTSDWNAFIRGKFVFHNSWRKIVWYEHLLGVKFDSLSSTQLAPRIKVLENFPWAFGVVLVLHSICCYFFILLPNSSSW